MAFKQIPFKLIALLGVLAFAITLAVIIGERLSTEAMAVLMGIAAGVAASIPTSLIVVWIAMQSMIKQLPPHPAPRSDTPPAESRVVVVQQPAPMPMPHPAYAQPAWAAYPQGAYAAPGGYPVMPAPRPPRKFTVIGSNSEPEEVETLLPFEPEL